MTRDGAHSRLDRRELLAGLAALPAVTLMGCGDTRAGPPLSALTAPTIRVRLGVLRPQAELRLPAGGWEIVGEGGRAFSLRQPGALAARLAAGPTGVSLGGRDTGAQALRVRAPEAFALDAATFSGALLVRREGAKLSFVNELDLETYTAGVVPNEAAPGAPPATHRAQAVASRTYAYVLCTGPGADEALAHVADGESSQVYKGHFVPPTFGAGRQEVLQRCAETRGVVLTWQSRAFPAYYASTCGGHTTEAATSALDPRHAAEPLRGVKCGYCSTSSRYRWTKLVSDADLVAGLARKKYPAAEPLLSVEVVSQGRGGWAKEVVVTGGPNRSRRLLPGAQFRSAAGLSSHNILAIRRVADGFEIDGAGWGHGVGMCQWGAFEMAKRGFSETDILRAYYPGAAFTRVY